MTDKRFDPIGVFDSGVGGLSVLRAIRARMPGESVVYFGDQKHVPYGPRPSEQVRAFSEAITHFLLDQDAKIIVVACNTASVTAGSKCNSPLSVLFEERTAGSGLPFLTDTNEASFEQPMLPKGHATQRLRAMSELQENSLLVLSHPYHCSRFFLIGAINSLPLIRIIGINNQMSCSTSNLKRLFSPISIMHVTIME